MNLINFEVERIIIHQIFAKSAEHGKIPPEQSTALMRFDRDVMTEFKKRVVDAVGSNSKAVQMDIFEHDVGELPFAVDSIINLDDKSFITASFNFAKRLTKAQNKTNIPGGILVIFQGTRGKNKQNLLGIIKAEMYTGYKKETNKITQEIMLEYVTDLLLTPDNRLYKTAVFFENDTNVIAGNLNSKWDVLIADNQVSRSQGKVAAEYFYSDFLGCRPQETDALITKGFRRNTSKFIGMMAIDSAEKFDRFNTLTSYLKYDTSTTASVEEFAKRYFEDVKIRDDYKSHMKNAGIPNRNFVKDTQFIAKDLKMQRVRFRSKVNINIPTDADEGLVTFEEVNGENDSRGRPKIWTNVLIKDEMIVKNDKN